jgi:hypothetical protein
MVPFSPALLAQETHVPTSIAIDLATASDFPGPMIEHPWLSGPSFTFPSRKEKGVTIGHPLLSRFKGHPHPVFDYPPGNGVRDT